MPLALHTAIARVDRAFVLGKAVADDETKAHYARYLCVLTAGLLEEGVRTIIVEYSDGRCSSEIANFVAGQADDFQNPKYGKILSFLDKFGSKWTEALERSVSEQVRDHIDSVVARRHLIAHGREGGLSFGTVSAYYESAKIFLEKLKQVVIP